MTVQSLLVLIARAHRLDREFFAEADALSPKSGVVCHIGFRV
jgi:hypothetical protein